MSFDPAGSLRVLTGHGVRFVVIGGAAGALRGSPLLTGDLDICYERSDDNLERLAAALRELSATLRGAPEDVPFRLDARTLRMGDAFTFDTTQGPVDILGRPAGSDGYEALDRNASTFEVAGMDIRVASLDDLIRMKRAAGRPRDLAAAEILGALRDEIEGRPDG
ncbi:MAG: nucleotidyltransferase [Actinomycetota bacterium]|nr:nucleotidyltransferase [Actinomycetota bacterium]